MDAALSGCLLELLSFLIVSHRRLPPFFLHALRALQLIVQGKEINKIHHAKPVCLYGASLTQILTLVYTQTHTDSQHAQIQT